MNQITLFILGIKREFWEHRRTIIWIPLIFSVLLLFASAAVTISQKTENQPQTSQQEELEQPLSTETAQPPVDIPALQKRTSIRYAVIYTGLAWLVSIFYLLSSFYSDRKDNSVLYWKSLPVSETHHALSKLVFGAVCFPIVALVIAWVFYSVLTILGFGAMHSVDEGDTWVFVERAFDAYRLMIMPLVGIIAGLLWGLPMFCYALMVSAMSKRFPFLMFLLPLIALAVIENITYQGSYLVGFITDHFPFSVLDRLSHSASLQEFFKLQFIDKAASLVGGWVLASVFLTVAIWYRNNRFEI